jgi:hypothetical protein
MRLAAFSSSIPSSKLSEKRSQLAFTATISFSSFASTRTKSVAPDGVVRYGGSMALIPVFESAFLNQIAACAHNWRRQRLVVVRPHRGRRCRNGSHHRADRRRACTGARLAAGSRGHAWRKAPAAGAGLARTARRRHNAQTQCQIAPSAERSDLTLASLCRE